MTSPSLFISFSLSRVVCGLIKCERPFLEVALAGLEPKCILAKSGDVPDGNETISSHLGLEPEALGDSRWATFPRRASHCIGEFGQPKKGEVEWSGVERSGRHGLHLHGCCNCRLWGKAGRVACVGMCTRRAGRGWCCMCMWVVDALASAALTVRAQDHLDTPVGLGQVLLRAMLLPMHVLCARRTRCCVRHEDEDDDNDVEEV